MLAPVSRMKLAVLSTPSRLTSPLQKPLEVVRIGISMAFAAGAGASHPRARVYDEAQHLLRAVDAHAHDGAVVHHFDGDFDAVGAAGAQKVGLRAEVAQEVYEAAYARASVFVGARRDAQELLVGVGGLAVALEA